MDGPAAGTFAVVEGAVVGGGEEKEAGKESNSEVISSSKFV